MNDYPSCMPNFIQIREFIVLCELQSENPYFWPKRHAIRTHAYWLAKHTVLEEILRNLVGWSKVIALQNERDLATLHSFCVRVS